MPFKICFVSIDLESDRAKNKQFLGIENLDKILDIFEKYNVSATLFVTGNVLKKYSQKIKRWEEKYEIASHSFSHRFWDTLDEEKRKDEVEKFFYLYQKIFSRNPKGFRAPSHVIDKDGLKLLQEKGFLYDSSIVPHYPFFKKYRGYKKRAPLFPYWLDNSFLEIPVRGLFLGIPLAGAWLAKIPFFFYRILLYFTPSFLTFSLHSWDSLTPNLLRKIEQTLKILEHKNYKFLNGSQIYELLSKSREQ